MMSVRPSAAVLEESSSPPLLHWSSLTTSGERWSLVMLSRFLVRLVKGILLYMCSLIVITAVAAVMGCLFLPNGHVGYLLDPAELLTFIWVTRAGLKVTILAVTTAVFLLLVGDGTLNRKWL